MLPCEEQPLEKKVASVETPHGTALKPRKAAVLWSMDFKLIFSANDAFHETQPMGVSLVIV
jgi:hypothetical protein